MGIDCNAAETALERFGLLLMQDKHIRSVVGVLTGESLATSWWTHPDAHAIFRCLDGLGDQAIVSRLIGRKVTYVHRRLWPAFLAVATSREAWQSAKLPADARRLLARVEAGEAPLASGRAARELQERLLVAAEEVHTESGRHAIRLRTWDQWVRGRGQIRRVEVGAARDELETAASAIGAPLSGLPWNR